MRIRTFAVMLAAIVMLFMNTAPAVSQTLDIGGVYSSPVGSPVVSDELPAVNDSFGGHVGLSAPVAGPLGTFGQFTTDGTVHGVAAGLTVSAFRVGYQLEIAPDGYGVDGYGSTDPTAFYGLQIPAGPLRITADAYPQTRRYGNGPKMTNTGWGFTVLAGIQIKIME